MNKKQEMYEWKKEINDFCVKYKTRYKKYDIRIIKKAYRRLKEKGTDSTITEIDLESILSVLDEKIRGIESNPSVKYEKKESNENEKEYKTTEMLLYIIRLLQKDLPEATNPRYFQMPYKMKSAYRKDTTGVVSSNINTIISLKEAKVGYMTKFVHTVYKRIPSLLKGDEG